jgi:hypothetical protein
VETFVVRIFVPAGEEKLELTGVVEHSGSGRSEHFRGAEGLLGVVLHQLELGLRVVPPGDQTTADEER